MVMNQTMRRALRERGLDDSGKKPEVLARLQDAVDAEEKAKAKKNQRVSELNGDMDEYEVRHLSNALTRSRRPWAYAALNLAAASARADCCQATT
jgi:hypothetical protein